MKGEEIVFVACCNDFAHARQMETDSDCYRAAIYEYEGELNIGCGLPPIKYCPWCGKEVGVK